MRHTMSTPCADCPFRNDLEFHLHPERAVEIAESLMRQESFPCHKTMEFDDDEGDLVRTENSVQCAGAEILLARHGMSTQLARIMECLGAPVAELDMSAPVYESFGDFVRDKGGEWEEE